jgi:hypothetical protein
LGYPGHARAPTPVEGADCGQQLSSEEAPAKQESERPRDEAIGNVIVRERMEVTVRDSERRLRVLEVIAHACLLILPAGRH